MHRGLVVSDLHLLAGRSDERDLTERLGGALEGTDLLVLNGDTFDFRWSALPNEEASLHAAIRWLEELMDRFSGERVHYLLGNHDCLHAFRGRLDDLGRRRPQFRWHENELVLGRNIFLHGDCSNRRMDAAALARYRDGWSRDRPRGRVQAALRGAIDATGMAHGVSRHYFAPGRSVGRVTHYLDRAAPGWKAEVDHCYFGHTHVPFADHLHDGVRFHNTGSGIRGMGFQPLRFRLSPDETPTT